MEMRYKLLGGSGLKVSEISLGTMTFGEDWGFGASAEACRGILEAYRARGGNFIDTANKYTNGSSERIVGELVRGDRGAWVIATKYSLSMNDADPSASGNGRKNLVQSVEASLKRLGTDYIDLLWVHAWDWTTPEAELMRALDDVVRAGKVLYVGMSDAPAWVVSGRTPSPSSGAGRIHWHRDRVQPDRAHGGAGARPDGVPAGPGRARVGAHGRRCAHGQVHAGWRQGRRARGDEPGAPGRAGPARRARGRRGGRRARILLGAGGARVAQVAPGAGDPHHRRPEARPDAGLPGLPRRRLARRGPRGSTRRAGCRSAFLTSSWATPAPSGSSTAPRRHGSTCANPVRRLAQGG